MKKLTLALGMAAAAFAGSVALAGPGGPGPGYGAGPGAGCVEGAVPGAGCGYGPGAGMGPGYGMGQGRGMGGRGYGMSLLTPEERTAHMNAMHSLKTVDECNAYLAEHEKLIAERAQQKGVALPTPRGDACERMKAHGLLH